MIVIDNRKGSGELIKYFPASLAYLDTLDFADFVFIGNGPSGPVTIGVERKVMSDLISSMTSGRLSGHQLPGLLSTYNYIWIIIEGIWQTSPTDGLIQMWTRNGWKDYKFDHRFHKSVDIIKYLITLTVRGNVRLWFTSNPKETVHFIVSLYRWWTQKEYEEHQSHIQEHDLIIDFKRPNQFKRIIKAIDNVGKKKTKLIYEKFSSPLEMCLADEKTWQEIPGVGKKLACKIVNSLQGGG